MSSSTSLSWSPAELAERRRSLRAAAARGLRPPPAMRLSEWAERTIVLPRSVASSDGPLSFERTPYVRVPLDAMGDPDVERVTVVSSTQVGKTTLELCCLAAAARYDVGPALSVQPNEDFAKALAVERVIPVFRASPELARLLPRGRGLTVDEMVLDTTVINFGSARSAADLSSRAKRYIIFGETEEYPPDAGKGGSPIAQAEERARTFWNRKFYESSTPKHELGHIWRSWERSNRHHYFLQCPHCGAWQAPTFDGRPMEGVPGPHGRIGWPVDEKGHAAATPDEIQEGLLAWYVCGGCGGVWEERQKDAIVARGEWRSVTPERGRRHLGYHLWAVCSPWLSFSEIAAAWLRWKDYPELVPVFVNKWLARPYKEAGEKPKAEAVLARRKTYPMGSVPAGVRFLTAGVDVHASQQYWMVWGWGIGFTGWLIAAGREDTAVDARAGWERVFAALSGEYPAHRGEGSDTSQSGSLRVGLPAGLALVDCGWDKPTDAEENVDEWAVLDLCDSWNFRVGGPLFQPSKGASNANADYLRFSRAYDRDREGKPLKGRLQLHQFNPWFFKKSFYRRLQTAGDVGGFWLPEDLPRAVMDQMLGEEMVVDAAGREEWKKTGANHWLDTAVLCLAAAWKYRQYLEAPPPTSAAAQAPNYPASGQGGQGGSWKIGR